MVALEFCCFVDQLRCIIVLRLTCAKCLVWVLYCSKCVLGVIVQVSFWLDVLCDAFLIIVGLLVVLVCGFACRVSFEVWVWMNGWWLLLCWLIGVWVLVDLLGLTLVVNVFELLGLLLCLVC